MKKERGIFLTILLVFATFGLFSLIAGFINPSLAPFTNLSLPSWHFYYRISGAILVALAIYGIWTWKKWGVYILTLNIILDILIGMIIAKSFAMNQAALANIFGFLSAGLWFWAIYRKWKYFK